MKDMRPAFARPASTFGPSDARILPEQEGMTYREWAAAQNSWPRCVCVGEGDWDEKFIAKIAVTAYRRNDSLLKTELDKEDRND